MGAAGSLAAAESEFFESKVRPVLAANCYGCHTKTAMGGLRLDTREGAAKVTVAGKPDDSVLIQAVRRTHAKLKMPPTGPLKPDEVAVLERWVREGAVFPDSPSVSAAGQRLWSFEPLRKADPPKLKDDGWARGPVDRFVLAALEGKGLRPVAPADRRSLLRRVSLNLTGLPPAAEQADAFANDSAPDAFAKVVDRLLDSPAYGERWARHWLDLARYSDGRLAAGVDTPMPNAWRYRDWVVDALNKDLPYDQFVRAQIAADLLPEAQRESLMPGLGFQSIGLDANDQLDVTTKTFLGLTVGCAQCHDHKYDPIPTRDYYSLLGVFRSSASHDHPLVPADQVPRYQAQQKKIDEQKEIIDEFLKLQTQQLVDILALQTSKYMVAAWKVQAKAYPDVDAAAKATGLDRETLNRWVIYLSHPEDREHEFLKPWYAVVNANPDEAKVQAAAEEFQRFVLKLLDDQKEVEDKNYVAFGGKKGSKDERTRQYTNIVALPVLKFYQWRELASEPYRKDGHGVNGGVYHYGSKEVERFLGPVWKAHLDFMRANLKALETAQAPMYPFLHAMKEGKPADIKVQIRGDAKQLGEIAPRRFLTALAPDGPMYQKGSGRLQLAEDILRSPLAARVIVNRVWQHHFGHGLVRSHSNFGNTGERPTHPELLDYLASRLIENRWSLKALHREILLSNTYQLSTASNPKNYEVDPENKLLWRSTLRHRLDLEALRDSVLAVSGKLDSKRGGPPSMLSDGNYRRSIYLTVSRTRLDGTMGLFDFPDPNALSDERPVTVGPLQGLFFLNSSFVSKQAEAIGERLKKEAGEQAEARVRRAYGLMFGRQPEATELKLGLEYVAGGETAWPRYLQALLASSEFTSVN